MNATEHDGDPGTDKELTQDSSDAPEGRNDKPESPRKTRKGRGLAWFALLVALIAAGIAGYALWHPYEEEPADSQTSERLSALNATLAQLERTTQSARDDAAQAKRRSADNATALAALQTQLTDLENGLENRQQGIAELRAELDRLAQRMATFSPGEALRELKLVELEMLLRQGYRTLTLDGNVGMAIETLESADALLADMNAGGLQPVRRALRDEIATLEGIDTVDIAGLSARLNALIKQVPALPLKDALGNTRFEAPNTTQDDRESGWWDATTDFLGRYFTVRRTGESGTDLPAPDTLELIHEQLQLKLEQARLALLRGAPEIYQSALTQAQNWTRRYFDVEARPVTALLQELKALENTAVKPDLPPTGAALEALNAARAGSS